MLDVYADFAETEMAMPVIKGEKTAGERFPGAVAPIHRSHDAGPQSPAGGHLPLPRPELFAAAGDQIPGRGGGESFAWTTSWGVSTRFVGALIMTHSDDDGLVLPPRLAPKHVVILPIYRGDDDRSKSASIATSSKRISRPRDSPGKIRVQLDDRDLRGGEKAWQHIKKGVPLRAEIGPRDIEKDAVFLARRDTGTKETIGRQQLVETAPPIFSRHAKLLFQRALKLREENTCQIDTLDEFKAYFTPKNDAKPEIHAGFAYCHWSEEPAMHELLKDLKVTVRCVPLSGQQEPGKCIFTGKPSTKRAIFAKAY